MTKEKLFKKLCLVHFKCSSEEKLEEEWEKISLNFNYYDEAGLDFTKITDQKLFKKRLESIFKEDEIKLFISTIKEDKVFFSKVINFFDKTRDDFLNLTETSSILKEINEDGIAIVRGMFTEEKLDGLINFQNTMSKILGSEIFHSGYINLRIDWNRKMITGAFLSKTEKNNGMVRLQSKSMGFFHPGLEEIIIDQNLLDVFRKWYNNSDVEIKRATMDWITPAPFNHNGWHFDVLRDQLKAMILLSEVNLKNAPMFYAKKTHKMLDEQVLEKRHKLINLGLSKKVSKNHDGQPCPVSYMLDDEVNNAPTSLGFQDVLINEKPYQKAVCVGNIGDVIFFESSGFHSGNICLEGMRKDIVLTVDSSLSFKNIFFDFMSFDC